MARTLTAVHHSVSTLRCLISKRNWSAAYKAADKLASVMNTEAGQTEPTLPSATIVSDLASERLKRAHVA